MGGLLEGILGNSIVQNLAFGQLKGLFKEKDLDFILVRLDQEGEIELALYAKGEAQIVTLGQGIIIENPKPNPAAVIQLTAPKKGKKGGK